jgi:hypothetical protein
VDNLVKSQYEVPRWLDKKFDIQGVVFLAGSLLYMQYVGGLPKTYNEGDRTFYDAIIVDIIAYAKTAKRSAAI